MADDGWGMLIAGAIVCAGGVVLGSRWKTDAEEIAAKLDPVKAAVETLSAIFDDYKAKWHRLLDKYTVYESGGQIDWVDVQAEEEELRAVEQQIAAQVSIVEGVIHGLA
jgi:hypothetical protein